MKERDGTGEDSARTADGLSASGSPLPSIDSNDSLFTHFTQNLPGLAWVKDLQGRYLYVNEATRRLFGTEALIVGKTDEELFPPHTSAQFRANDRIVLDSKRAIQTTEELQQADGLHRSLVSKFPIFGKDGEVVMVGGMAIDITEHLRVRDELRQSQDQLQLIANHASIFIAYCDAGQQYRYVNQAYAARMKLTTADILGKHVAEVLGQPAYNLILPYIQTVLAGEPVEFELPIPYERLGLRFIHCAYLPDRALDGSVRGWVAVVTDITERKQVESILQEGEERYRRLIQHLPAALYTIDSEGHIKLYNEAAVALWGREPDLEKDRWCGSHRIYRPDGTLVPHDECPMAVAVKEGLSVRDELIIERPDGNRRHVLVYPDPIRDGTGAVVGGIKMLVDITERKQMENLLAGQQKALQLAVDGAPLRDVLEVLTRTVETHLRDGVMASILLLDREGRHLHHGAAPSLPEPYSQALDGVAIGPAVGSCGTAAFRNEPVIVEDIASHPFWTSYRDLALQYGLRACWSMPIRSAKRVLGTFALYYRHVRNPSPEDYSVVELLAHTAAVVIERDLENRERSEAEQALRESERRFRHMADHAPVMVWVSEPDGRCSYLSQSWYDFTGQRAESGLGTGWTAAVYVEDRTRVWETFMASNARRESIQTEFRLLRHDGQVRWALTAAAPRFSDGGEFLGFIGSVLDITERKAAEDLVREQAALLEQTHDAIFVWRLDGGITYWGQGAERLYGYTEREALGRRSHELLKTRHPLGMHPIQTALQQEGSWSGELIHTTSQGTELTVESRLLLSRRADGQLLVLDSNHDITSRKRTETALRDSEERLRLATQTGKVGIWDWDISTNRVTWSDSLYAVHGVRRDQFNGTVEGFESLVHADDRARVGGAIQAALIAGSPYELEFRAVRPNGDVIWLFTNATVLREGERPVRMIGATFDLTDRKRAEEALRDSETLYRTLMEQAHDGIIVCDQEGRFVMVNEVLCRLLGYTVAELLGRPVQDTYVDSERGLFLQRLTEIKGGKRLQFERKFVRKDGSLLDAEVSVAMLPNGHGYAVVRDITARKRTEAAAATRTERMRLLSETLAQLLSAKDPETIVRELFPQVAAHLNVDTYFNFMVDETGEALRLHSWAGMPEEVVRSFERLEFGQAICGTVAQRREPIIANDIQHSTYDKAALVRGLGIQTYACHPLMAGGRLLGTLSFASRTRSSFDDDEIEFVRIISQYTAIALDRLRTTKALSEHTRSLEIVNRVGTTLAAELDLSKLVQSVTDAGREVSGAEFGAFFYNVQNNQGESYQLFTLSGAPPEAFAGFGMPRNTPVFGPTFRGEAPIRVADILADPRYGTMAPHFGMPKGHLPVRSYLAVPVVSRSGEVLGGLFFGHQQPGMFTSEAENILVGIAAQAAVAIDNANLYDAVQKELAEHKRIEEALRASEEKFRTMADHIAQFAWMTDAEGWIFWYNRRWFEYTGTTLDEMQGWGWQKVHHPDHVERVTAKFRRCLEAGVFWEDTFPLRGRDGEYRWFLSRAVPIRDDQGRVLRWFGTNTDVTAERETENALRRSEALYQAIGESIDFGIWVCNAEGENTYASESFLALVGLTQEQCAGFGWGRVLHPDDVERTILAWRECVRTGSVWDYEHRVLGVDGHYHPILARGVPMRDDLGRIVGWAGINLDISGLRQAQDDLREKSERLLIALSASHTGTFRWNLRTDEMSWDDAVGQLFGFASGQTATSLDQFLHLVHPDDRRTLLRACEPCRDTAVDFEAEFRIVLPDGGIRWMYERGKPISLGTDSRPEYMTGAFVDITERKAAEEQLRQWTADLEERVRERTEQLTRSQERLRSLATEVTLTEQKERRRIASELHDYLAQLLVLGRIKLTQLRKQVTLSQEKWVHDLDQLLDQSLTYTRSLVAQLSPPVLHEFGLLKALQWLGGMMEQHGLKVEVQVVAGRLVLPEDQAILLYQSVRELLMNVVKHARSEHATITVQVSSDDVLHILVADDGKGFDSDALLSSEQMSSRYGLFSIRERMAVMGGALTVSSAPGQGTRVTITIPYARETAGADPRALSNARPGSAGQSEPGLRQLKAGPVRVVLVDDHAMVRQGLRSILDSYEDITIVGEAGNGLDAVNLARELKPHVVVMDLNMPIMDGIEATRRIKDACPSIIIIGLSVRNDREAEEAMRQAGASGYLTKESAAEQLHQAIGQLLQDAPSNGN